MSFAESRTVFEDDEARLMADPEHSAGEARFIPRGLSSAVRVLVVVRCEAVEDGIAIISARKADPSERRIDAQRRAR